MEELRKLSNVDVREDRVLGGVWGVWCGVLGGLGRARVTFSGYSHVIYCWKRILKLIKELTKIKCQKLRKIDIGTYKTIIENNNIKENHHLTKMELTNV